MAGTNELTIYFDSISIRQVAKDVNKRTDYRGLMSGLKHVFSIAEAKLYIVKNTDNPTTKFDAYVEQIKKSEFTPVVQELCSKDGFYTFTPQICIDALNCKTEYVAIGTTDIGVLPLFKVLQERGHKVCLMSVTQIDILMPYVTHFFTAVS